MVTESLQYLEIETAPNPKASVIWLHGLGADGHDFVPMGQLLPVGREHALRYIFPHAPERPVTVNNGMRMRAWYDIYSLSDDINRMEDREGLDESAISVQQFVDREIERGMTPAQIIVGGFSQGCATSLYYGLRMKQSLAGIIGLSGYLPFLNQSEQEQTGQANSVPIFLGHGTHDEVVPVIKAEQTYQYLRRLEYNITFKQYPIGHSVDIPVFEDVSAFIAKVLCFNA